MSTGNYWRKIKCVCDPLSGKVWLYFLLSSASLSLTPAIAQDFQVSGTVRSASDNAPLPGVNIVEVGTQTGTTTDADGHFSFAVSGPDVNLSVSFIGYETQTVSVGGRSEIDIALQEDIGLLGEVVVTAMGIERDRRAIGYSLTQVGGEDLVRARDPNLGSALAGRVAGVQVTTPATGTMGSSRVIIRGNAALGAEADNQPLYVVDGVPMDNRNLGAAGMWGGVDQGDGLTSINPDDIESMSVLKGPAAAALYGSRAKNGVILISTKRGREGAGIGLEFNSNLTFEEALVTHDAIQTQYGQGTLGTRPTNAEQALSSNLSNWGEPFDGQSTIQFDGVERPYSYVGDNQRRFYEPGLAATNTVALSNSVGGTNYRLSYSNMTNNSIVPNSAIDRHNLTFRGSSTFGERLSADVRVNFAREDVTGRPRVSDNPGNPNTVPHLLAGNVDIRTLAGPSGTGATEAGAEFPITPGEFTQNPYWAAYHFRNESARDRLIGHAQVAYSLTDWLSLQGRIGRDWYTQRITGVEPWGTRYTPLGQMNDQEWRVSEFNSDFLFLANHRLTPTIGLSGNFGGNLMRQESELLGFFGSQFNIPGLEVIGNTRNQSPSYSFSEKQINSFYGTFEFSYADYLYLTATARNDWSSTLPEDNRSYFYPSVSASFVFTEALNMPRWVEFGKLRASWAEVGGDTDPYMLALTYQIFGQGHLGQPLGTIAQGTVPLINLRPSSSVGVELGFDAMLLDNRLGIDFAVYDQTVTDDILSTTVSLTSGFGSRLINAGELRNRGIELLLTTTPFLTPDFRWDVDFNFGLNRSEVVDLVEGSEVLNLDESRSQNAWIQAHVGEPYPVIVGYTYQRDDQGRIIHDSEGLPLRSAETSILGSAEPLWRGGVTNRFRYGNISLSALFDVQVGGEIYSFTNAYLANNGKHEMTLNRVMPSGGDDPEYPYVIGEGVTEDGQANEIKANAQSYWNRVAFNITEEWIYDASFIKLRSLEVGYRLPTSVLARLPVTMAEVSVVGRNLFILHKNTPNIDPESTYHHRNAQGLEMFGVPQVRNFGVNVNLRF